MKSYNETALVKDCLSYLQAIGVWAWRNNTGAIKTQDRFIRFGNVGSPDIFGILEWGRLLCVECKIKPNKLSKHQELWLESAKMRGALTVVAYSLDDLEALNLQR